MAKKRPSRESRQALNEFKEEMAQEFNTSFANANHLTPEATSTHEAARDASKTTNQMMQNLFRSTSCGGPTKEESFKKK